MFSPNQQVPVRSKLLSVQVPSLINHVGQNDSPYASVDGAANSALSQAESLVYSSKKLEDELLLLGRNIKHHEENIKSLKSQKNSLDDQITDMQVAIGEHHSSSTHTTENEDLSHTPSEPAAAEHRDTQADPTSTNGLLGIVATLGKVEDDNLSRLLSEYVGLDTMIASVFMTHEALETHYDKEGLVSKSSEMHGRTLDGRYKAICLDSLRPYAGKFMPDDPQRRLALLKPKLPNGESPAGFLGFAVNMIHIDAVHLLLVTTDGHGLRDTLFYTLFSRLQVYKTRAHMLQALPCLSHGAISLDGGIIRSNGISVLGTREEMDAKFGISCYQPKNLIELEKKMKELKWKKETTMEDLQREEAILTHVKYTFEVKKQEFVRFMAQSSPYAMQYPAQATPRRSTPR